MVKAGEQKASMFNCSLIIGQLFFFLLLNTPIISDCLQVPAFPLQVYQRYLQIKKKNFFLGGGSLIMKKLVLEIHVSVLG
jgi:hypothetical protein